MGEANLISKTRRKRQMQDLQEIGAALTRLPPDQLARVEMPDDLREAVLASHKITRHEAARRQMQYIGRLMRELDAGPIAAQLEALHAPARGDTARLHRAERWRNQLMADPSAVDRFVEEFPEADPNRLRELASQANEERLGERPPRRFRELFQIINAILQDHARRNP
jgi:ribosome-associated protein